MPRWVPWVIGGLALAAVMAICVGIIISLGVSHNTTDWARPPDRSE